MEGPEIFSILVGGKWPGNKQTIRKDNETFVQRYMGLFNTQYAYLGHSFTYCRNRGALHIWQSAFELSDGKYYAWCDWNVSIMLQASCPAHS